SFCGGCPTGVHAAMQPAASAAPRPLSMAGSLLPANTTRSVIGGGVSRHEGAVSDRHQVAMEREAKVLSHGAPREKMPGLMRGEPILRGACVLLAAVWL